MKGKVKWFNNQKGYGFISDDESGQDVFVHYSGLNMEGFKSLDEGQEVEYDIVQGERDRRLLMLQSYDRITSSIYQES